MTPFDFLAMTEADNLDNYLRIAVLGVVAVVFGCLPLIIARLLRPKKVGEIKQAVFECGLTTALRCGGMITRVLRPGLCPSIAW